MTGRRLAVAVLAGLLALSPAAQVRRAAASPPLPIPAAVTRPASAGGASADPRYTIVAKGENFEPPTDTPRIAVLIGNGRYDAAPDNSGNPLKAKLPKLDTPCSDVKAIANKLIDLGWARDEVYVLCEQSNLDTYAAMDSLRASAPGDGTTKRLMVLYLAGHGMEIDGDNYFFGISARLNLETVAGRLAGKLKNPNKEEAAEPLLATRDAVNIDGVFGSYRSQPDLSYAFLVLVDTCRNNPLLAYVDQEADARRQDPNISESDRNYWSLLRRFMSRAKTTPGWPKGLEMVYATRPNNVIADDGGAGGSRLATALVGKLVSDTAIRIILSNVDKEMKRVQGNRNAPDYQELDSNNDVSSDPNNEWCMIGCKLPGGPDATDTGTGDLLTPQIQKAGYWRGPRTPQSVPQANDAAASPRTIVRAFRRFRAPALRKVLVRISWCSGDAQGPAREADARRAYDALTASLARSNRVRGDSQIFGTQLIEIPPDTNRLAIFQRRFDVEIVDPVRTDHDENMLADLYLKPIKGALPVRGTDFPSPNVIDLFYCRGAYKGPLAPIVFLQVLHRDDLPSAAQLWTILKDKSPDLKVIPKTEVMVEKPDWPLDDYPADTEVRIADPASRPRAQQLAKLLELTIGKPVPVLCIDPCHATASERSIEVWIGSGPGTKEQIKAVLIPFSARTRF